MDSAKLSRNRSASSSDPSFVVLPSFLRVCAPGRQKPDYGVAGAVAMDHDQDAAAGTESEQKETVLSVGMLGVVE